MHAMVAAANPPRPRIATTSSAPKGRFSAGMLVIIGIPVLLAIAVLWQLFAGMVHTEVAVRDAVAVSRVSLESDPVGTRIDLVLVDRVGQDTTVNGNLNIKLREP